MKRPDQRLGDFFWSVTVLHEYDICSEHPGFSSILSQLLVELMKAYIEQITIDDE